MDLTTEDVIEVEKHIEEHKGITYVFSPRGVGDYKMAKYSRQDYLDWLCKQYPDIVFRYTNSMLTHSLMSRVSEYLTLKWDMRNLSLGIIRHNMVRFRDEIAPLKKIKETIVCLKQAQREMDNLRI